MINLLMSLTSLSSYLFFSDGAAPLYTRPNTNRIRGGPNLSAATLDSSYPNPSYQMSIVLRFFCFLPLLLFP